MNEELIEKIQTIFDVNLDKFSGISEQFDVFLIEALRYMPLILGILLFISAIFFLRGIWYRLRLGWLVRKIRKTNTKDNHDLLIKTFPTRQLQHLWKEYNETLHPQHEEVDGQLKTVAYRSTTPAEMYFNEQYVVDNYLRTEFFKHFPGVFTGLGIVATFAGVMKGLKAFSVSENPETVRNSLETLMQHVGTAFVMSATAISLAMLFTLFERFLLSSLYKTVEKISQAIDSHFKSGVDAEYMSRLVEASESSASQAKILKDSLVNDLKTVLQELTQSQIEAGRTLHNEQINTSKENNQNLSEGIANSIEKSLKQPLDEIASSVRTATSDQSNATIEMLSDIMVQFSQRLNDLFGGQINGINELNKQTADSMQDAVTSLKVLLERIEDSGKRTTDDMATKIAASIQAMEERQSSINEQTQEFVNQISKLVENSQSETQQKLQDTLASIEEGMKSMLENINNSHLESAKHNQAREQKMTENTSNFITQMTGSVENAIQVISNASETMAQSVNSLSNTTKISVDKMNEGADKLGTAASSFALAGNSVSKIFEQTDSIGQKLTQASNSISTSTNSLQSALKDYSSQQEAMKSILSEVNELIEIAGNEARISSEIINRIEESSNKLKTAQLEVDEYLEGVSEVLEKSSDSFSNAVVNTLNKVNNDFHESLSSAVGMLSSTIEELEASLGNIGAPER